MTQMTSAIILCEHWKTEHYICNCLPGEDQHGEWCKCLGTRVELTEIRWCETHGESASASDCWLQTFDTACRITTRLITTTPEET